MENQTVLIVDDEERNIKLVKAMLMSEDYRTISVLSGEESLGVVAQERPDVILLDVMMPGMDGFGVCNKLRTDVKTAFIPIMMLTANSSEEGRTKGYLVGADDYVSKPFSVPELNARVTRLLHRTYGLS